MSPNYKYSFFNSFNASPTLSLQAWAPPSGMVSEVERSSDVVPNSCMVAPPVVFDSIVQSVPIEIDDLGVQVVELKSSDETELETLVVEESKGAVDVLPRWDTPQKAKLEIIGQGTASVNADSTIGFHVVVQTEDTKLPNLYLDVTQDSCSFSYGGLPTLDGGTLSSASRQPFPDKCLTYPKGMSSACLRVDQGPYKHWLSIDRENGILRYGRGYCTASLVLLQAVFKEKKDSVLAYIDNKWEWLRHLQNVEAKQTGGQKMTELVVDPFPLVRDLPPYVVKDQDVTLDDLESGIVTVVANLPEACQVLYKNVAGPKIVLDTLDFPDFSQAIERSVRTEGLLGHDLLTKKAKKAGGECNFLGTYLRITLGTNLGNSPGIPYVLEIWPSGHSSPIHDHGDSYAVIKVLCGEISAYYFDSLEKPGPNQIGRPAILKKDDVTWISSNNYQVHQLKNESDKLCCTIQCYQYGPKDKAHYEGFRFIANGKHSASPDDKPFFPNSDMAFGEFKKAVKKEWYAYQLEKM